MCHARLTLAVCLMMALAPPRAAAQHEPIDKGTLLVGGAAGISGFHNDGDSTSRFSLSLAPMFGGFLWRGVAVWGGVSFGYSSSPYYRTTTWGVGPGIAYYFSRVLKRAYPYFGVEASFVWATQRARTILPSGSVTEAATDAVHLRPSVGLLFMLVSHVGVRGELYVSRSWTTSDLTIRNMPSRASDQNATTYGFSAGVTAFVF